MSKELKTIISSAIVCALGAILLDCGMHATGIMLIGLGSAGIIFGPVAIAFFS